ncbi:MAG TPA: pentapeptide repeat-containing protein, partial [Verrucomicrobiae bacterium]|nr:pentapeptide repeat-containing protein [Verrucomicrobiae bacterium]
GADLAGADLSGADLDNADLHDANLQNIRWREIQSIKNAQIVDVKNAPPGFIDWGVNHGAVASAKEDSGVPTQK